jgi:hypothetical protein
VEGKKRRTLAPEGRKRRLPELKEMKESAKARSSLSLTGGRLAVAEGDDDAIVKGEDDARWVAPPPCAARRASGGGAGG